MAPELSSSSEGPAGAGVRNWRAILVFAFRVTPDVPAVVRSGHRCAIGFGRSAANRFLDPLSNVLRKSRSFAGTLHDRSVLSGCHKNVAVGGGSARAGWLARFMVSVGVLGAI